MELQRVIHQLRDPDALCMNRSDCENEFGHMLKYLQGMPSSSAKKPDYVYIKKCFNAMKEKKGFSSSLEWSAGFNSVAPTPTAPSKPTSIPIPVLEKAIAI